MASEWKLNGTGYWVYKIESSTGRTHYVELQETKAGYWMRMEGVVGGRYLTEATLDAAKLEALRLVREAVKRLADAVGE